MRTDIRQSVRKLMEELEELARASGMKTDLVFVKPPGYKYEYSSGCPIRTGQYQVNLKLLRGENHAETILGNGNTPLAAIRESSVKAREFLRNYGTYFEPRQDPPKNENLP